MKKLISFIAALAVVASSVVAFAAPTASSSNPAIRGTCDSVDGDGYLTMYFALENNETLVSYSSARGKITINSVNAMQVTVELDPTVFDTTETYITPNTDVAALAASASAAGDNTAELIYTFGPTAISGYLTTVPEYLFKVEALLQDGYDITNIPNSAVTFGPSKVEYTSYESRPQADGPTNYTIYGANTTGTKDYDLTVSFTGTASGGSEEPEVFEAVIDENGIVSFNNSELSGETPSAILDTHEVKVFSNKFSGVTADTRFDITHGGVTKTFGWTLGEYFGITGIGTLEGTLGVAVLFPKGDTNDFEITMK